MTITLSALQKQRWDTAANWTAENPTLLAGEIGIESDTGYWKVGNGSTTWTSLAYMPALGGKVGLPDGTAGAPALYFADDTNTGIYSPGADQVALSTGGTGRLFVDSAGGTRIETVTVPIIASRASAGSGLGGLVLRQSDTTNGNGLRINYQSDTTGTGAASNVDFAGIQFSADIHDQATRAGSIRFLTSQGGVGDSQERLRITSAGLVGVGTSVPSYKLEVGTTSDASNHINIKTSTTGTASFYFSDTNNGQAGIDYNHSTDKLTIRSADATAITIDSSQRVGIGSTSPDYKLTVADTGSFVIQNLKSSTTQFCGIYFGDTDAAGQGVIVYDNSTDAMTFRTNGSGEDMRIDSSGRLLVGTSSAQAYVSGGTQAKGIQIAGSSGETTAYTAVRYGNDIPGSFLSFSKSRGASIGTQGIVSNGDQLGFLAFHGSDGSNFIRAASITAEVDGTPGANDMPGRLVFSTTADGASSPTTRITLKSDGRCVFSIAPDTTISRGAGGTPPILTNSSSDSANAGIEIATDSTATRYCQIFTIATNIVGSITTSGSATAYNTSSDYRLKENVAPVTDGITRLQQLKPSRFNFIADPDTVVDGFIAHEVQTIVPEAITGEKDAVDDDGNPIYQGIDQSKLVPLLTAALQEAIGEIESLKARVAALEAP